MKELVPIEKAYAEEVLGVDILVKTDDGRKAILRFDNFKDFVGFKWSFDENVYCEDIDDDNDVPPFEYNSKYRVNFEVYYDSFKIDDDDKFKATEAIFLSE